ncbi:transglycosylase domain-containing protein [Ornithinimicrobium tianjinense]|nr:transglycosylase domain-containing protein [Ornithinimicrobium tianjinense]
MRSAFTAAKLTSLLGVFLAVSVLMGIIGAGLLAPVVGAAGFAAREGVGMFDRLPGDLDQNPLAQQSKILAANGKVLATPAKQNRIIVESKDISQNMKDAQVAIEDERFYQHGGMDLEALARAVVSNATSDNTQGGSTLTQQYIKMALKEEALKNRDAEALSQLDARSGMDGYVRKLRELKYAVTLEERLTKDEILVGYLNLAFYGDNVYGVEAAARHYFNTSAKKLTPSQAATLAGVVRSPTATNPVANPELAQERRDTVLDKMYAQKMITKKELKEAKAVSVTELIEGNLRDSQRSCINSQNPYFCDYVTAWLMQQPALGKTPAERLETLTTKGLTVETTLDLEMSKTLGQMLREATPKNKYHVGSAGSVVEPGTGHVLAINQSSKYSFEESSDKVVKTAVNWNVDSAYGGPGGMQIGSVAKAYTLVEALEKGIPVEATLKIDKPGLADSRGVWLDNPENPQPMPADGETHPVGVFKKEDFQEGCTLGDPVWTVRNAEDKNHDEQVKLRTAAGLSINTAFATLASQVGTCDIRDTMIKLGIHQGNGAEPDPFPPSIVLGSDYGAPLTVAASYAALAADGLYCPPVPVTKIIDSAGKEIPFEKPECEQVIDKEVALGTVELLKGVVAPTGSGWRAILDGNRPAGGKTGTNDNSSHTWFAGFTPQLSTAIFVGNRIGNSQPYDGDMVDLQIGDTYVDGPLFGSSLAAPTWKKFMDWAHRELPVEDWEKPSAEILNGKRVTIPQVIGMTETAAQEALRDAGLTGSIQRVASGQPEGTVVFTTPGVGSSIDTATPVVLHVSTGVPAPAPAPAPRPAPGPTEPEPDEPEPSAPPTTDPPTIEPPPDDGGGGGGGPGNPDPPGQDGKDD